MRTCEVCGGPLPPVPVRPQGGGTQRKYCSLECNKKSYLLRHPSRRKASLDAYEAKETSKKAKAARNRARKLALYGVDEDWVTRMLALQNATCATCAGSLDRSTARVDHNHTTGVARGLLCDHCNWALGHAKDNPETLQRMIDYLEKHGKEA